MTLTKPAAHSPQPGPLPPRGQSGPGPLYVSRTFDFDPDDPRKDQVTVSFEVQGDWEMKGPKGTTLSFPAGDYTLAFPRHSPQPLVRITIDPDPGGGRVP